jgi:hypothetical protein
MKGDDCNRLSVVAELSASGTDVTAAAAIGHPAQFAF